MNYRNLHFRKEEDIYWAFEPSFRYESGNKGDPAWILCEDLEGKGQVTRVNATLHDLDSALDIYRRVQWEYIRSQREALNLAIDHIDPSDCGSEIECTYSEGCEHKTYRHAEIEKIENKLKEVYQKINGQRNV